MEGSRVFKVTYRFMSILAVIAGSVGILLQFTSLGDLTLILAVPVLGGLIGGRNDYEPKERLQLERSFQVAFEWLLLVLLFAYAFVLLSKWLFIIEGAVGFLNSHWPILTISTMCLLMGISGSMKMPGEVSA